MKKQERGSFTGGIGFVLAAAGSAVGLGNLWRFPYLAAKDGGGLFLVVYIILALTFGFSLLTTEIAIGRKTQLSSILAYKALDKRFAFLGPIASAIPFIILPYYCVIGGWVSKYMFMYISGSGAKVVTSSYFTSFITAQWTPIFWCVLFIFLTSAIVYLGVEKGIEKFSKILMPLLCIMIVGIAVFSLTLKDAESGRTALQGLKIYLIPSFKGLTVWKFFKIVLDAMTQMFYSMSIAMGIMITYGSYTKKETNLVSSVNQIEIFDTAIAMLAGLIMIPAVFTFHGREGLDAAGPSLLFISLPKVFDAMGYVGNFVAAIFFVLVLFAALTSSISIMETVVSVFMDRFHTSREKTTIVIMLISFAIAIVTCLGYNVLYFEVTLPNGNQQQQLLDVFDFVANNLLMPIVAFCTCLLVNKIGRKTLIDEIKLNNEKFSREKLYHVMIQFVAPIFLLMILMSSFGIFNKL